MIPAPPLEELTIRTRALFAALSAALLGVGLVRPLVRIVRALEASVRLWLLAEIEAQAFVPAPPPRERSARVKPSRKDASRPAGCRATGFALGLAVGGVASQAPRATMPAPFIRTQTDRLTALSALMIRANRIRAVLANPQPTLKRLARRMGLAPPMDSVPDIDAVLEQLERERAAAQHNQPPPNWLEPPAPPGKPPPVRE